ncbi:hypothetical protein GCM10023149_38380 [Mucilaginibacter gynuensis]|uniref:Uncharacterized protein n=1 Tax=Mucilaginibacter gynuensis TaxID=1302236 RepID=A0ABP8GZP3_9SPHI
MGQLKALIIFIAVIIIPFKPKNYNVTFISKTETVVLKPKEYIINYDTMHVNLQVLNDRKFEKILSLKNPKVTFVINDNKFVAKGLWFLSSSVPDSADFFFSIDDERKIVKGQEGILYFIKVRK